MNRRDMVSAVTQCMSGGVLSRRQVVLRLREMGLADRRKVYQMPVVRAAYHRLRLVRLTWEEQ